MPSDSIRLWQEAIPQIRVMGGRLHIGPRVQEGHKIWQWKYDIKSLQPLHLKKDSVHLCEPALGEGARTRANCYVCTGEETGIIPTGGPRTGARTCKVVHIKSSRSLTTCQHQRNHQHFEKSYANGAIHGDGHKFLGESEDATGSWLMEAIQNNCLIAVTDGSYMKDLYQNMNSCAFILECT